LLSDCRAIAKRSKANGKQLQSESKAIIKQLQSDCIVIERRLRGNRGRL
jgi:hypothetical protein